MTTEIKLWQISNNQIRAVLDESLATDHVESELENWIVECPDILSEDLLIIARQKSISDVGIPDLLAINTNCELFVIELKREMMPREAVAQALDYASWLDMRSDTEILQIAEDFLGKPLEEAFANRFPGRELQAFSPQNHKILLVGSRLDASAERIINYLARRSALDINAIFFRYAKLPNGTEVLARSVLVADGLVHHGTVSGRKVTEAELIAMAAKRNIEGLVAPFHELAKDERFVGEESTSAYRGSFRYWRTGSDGKSKMVFGLNISGQRLGTPEGQLDIWIPSATLARVLSVSEQQALELLRSLPILEVRGLDHVVRVKSEHEAASVAKKLQALFETHPGFYDKAASASA